MAAPALLAKLDDGDGFSSAISSAISSDVAISSAGIDLPIQDGDDDDEAEPHVQLRVVLQGAELREMERAWLRLRSHGELDDTRLVAAAVGVRQVFKQRGTPPLRMGAHQQKPKHVSFLLDASASIIGSR